jgi:glycosyltransferase involved in cell wall biosynthesis
MSTICLCMIVRDESAVIERCLASVREAIDSWVICDTGSVDGTQAIIKRTLADIPGALHERPWRDFGHNRTELMRLARGAADYLLLLDADMTITIAGELPATLSADSYLVRHAGEPEYWTKRVVRGYRSWSYIGSTHEYLTVEGSEVEQRLGSIVIEHHADGGARAEKLERDVRLLERDLKRDQTNPRTIFYLAQTYRDLGELERAARLYVRRAGLGGWAEEVFYAWYQAGVLHAEIGDWPVAMATLIKAFEYRPTRLEPLYELAARLRLRGEYETAHLFAQRGVGRPMPDDVLFLHPWVYRWGLLFEYSITAYWTGHVESALRTCDQLLRIPELPSAYRAQTLANRRFCVERVRQLTTERGRTATNTIFTSQHAGE